MHPETSESSKDDAPLMLSRMPPEYEIREQFHSEQHHVKIIHVGAGVSGLLTAYKAKRYLKNYELTCYEKYASYNFL